MPKRTRKTHRQTNQQKHHICRKVQNNRIKKESYLRHEEIDWHACNVIIKPRSQRRYEN